MELNSGFAVKFLYTIFFLGLGNLIAANYAFYYSIYFEGSAVRDLILPYIMVVVILMFSVIMVFQYLQRVTLRLIFSEDSIRILKSKFLSSELISIDKDNMKKISIASGIASQFTVHLKVGDQITLETYGLQRFDDRWLEPPYNKYMPLAVNGRRTHKIAYNISKAFDIPLESDFINHSE